jgi:histone H3/H4
LTIKNAQDPKRISKDFANELQIDVNSFTVLYADHTVLLAESNKKTVGVRNVSLIHSNSHR